ncbi:uncharacterized protein DEA37_0007480, partial [Paragonimus westermani]
VGVFTGMCAIRYSRSRRDNGWSDQGGYMRAKQTKLEKQFDNPGGLKSIIFRNVSIYVNGYTTPSASVLRELVASHGGRYRTYYTRSTVTHIIASRLPTGKINRLTDQKLVTADWITESIKARRLLPWQQFQLYPGHLGGSGQQRLRISRISSTSQDFEQQSTKQDRCATSGNEDPNDIKARRLLPWQQFQLYPGHLGGSGQQRLRISRISSTSQDFEQQSTKQDRCATSGNEDPNESYGDEEVDAGQGESWPAVRACRVKQVRLDNCLSPVKLSTSSSARPKSSGSLSLKQLLRGFGSPNNSSVPCSSLTEVGSAPFCVIVVKRILHLFLSFQTHTRTNVNWGCPTYCSC